MDCWFEMPNKNAFLKYRFQFQKANAKAKNILWLSRDALEMLLG
jgi:hypothetical protein